MIITGGTYNGKKLTDTFHLKDAIRPTSSKVRSAIFDILLHNPHFKIHFQNLKVLDGFSGSGILGCEAYSRGATHITFIDKNRDHLKIIEQNTKLLGIKNARLINADMTQLPKAETPYDLIFLDPPYGLGLLQNALTSLISNGWTHAQTIIVIEEHKKTDLNLNHIFQTIVEKRYGISKIIIGSFAAK